MAAFADVTAEPLGPRVPAPPPTHRRPAWHRVYFALAAFDLCTVLFSLGLNHMVRQQFADSVMVNQRWGERLTAYSQLSELAGEVNAPGNDVFDSGDVASERQRMIAALATFERELDARRAELNNEPDSGRRAALRSHLDRADDRMADMVNEARLIFSYFDVADAAAAGRRMATMDRRFADVNDAIAQLREYVAEIQRYELASQQVAAERISRLEHLIAVLIVLMVSAAAMYGHRMSTQFDRESRARRAAELLAAEEQQRAASASRFQSLVANASDVIATADAAGLLTYVSPAVQRQWGLPPDTLVGTDASRVVHPDDVPAFTDALDQAASRADRPPTTEIRIRHADGSWRHVELMISNLLEDSGVSGLVLTFHDVTEHKRFERELRRLAFEDSLTQLPNRALFLDRLDRAMRQAARYNRGVGVIFLDLDNFKVVNDSLGHEAGDALLKAVAERATMALRNGDTVARLGGDEFTILVEDVTSADDARMIAERLCESLRVPVLLDGREIVVTASLGIAFGRAPTDTPDALLRNADLAMYRAKSSGKSGYAIFEESMNHAAMERLEIETDLRKAIERGELFLVYQPIVDLTSGRLIEVEALLRWQHPSHGLISPVRFIPVAEETGLIVEIGAWVIRQACAQVKVWNTLLTSQHLAVSVNLSARQFQQRSLASDIAAEIAAAGIAPSLLKLEITESALMRDADVAADVLAALRALGVQIAIDDFGTGYSSLSYLSRFPVDTLKVDRTFINGLGHDTHDASIVRSVIAMAKSLNLTITGEGIETAEQLAYLRSLGCHFGQGYYFNHPLPAHEISTLLTEHGSGDSARAVA
ncbi:MAG: EAL domain-containing protein [Chloroflexota bacterium]